MHASYLMFFLSLAAFAQAPTQIEVIPPPKTIEDFEHQYKGCLANSECDQVMGLQLGRWKELLTKINDPKMANAKKFQFLELFRSKYGIPVEFYTTQKSQQGFRPLLYNSSCKDHNPKEGEKVLRGMAFVKALTKDKAIIWRDQTQIEVPVGELLTPQPLIVYNGKETLSYNVPLGDQPLFIKDKSLLILKEDDGFFYALKISQKGEWKIENLDFTQLSHWEDQRAEVTCPKDEANIAPKTFGVEFCKTVWNDDLKKTVIVKIRQGCVI